MPASKRRGGGFDTLLSPPRPIPDDDEPAEVPERPGGVADGQTYPREATSTAEPATAEAAAAPAPDAGGAAEQAQPEVVPPPAGEASASPPTPGRVPTTIRLQPPEAAALRGEWLEARRRIDPTLSFPQFAGEIVTLGLAAYRRRGEP